MQCSSTAVWGKGSLLHRGQLRRALAPESSPVQHAAPAAPQAQRSRVSGRGTRPRRSCVPVLPATCTRAEDAGATVYRIYQNSKLCPARTAAERSVSPVSRHIIQRVPRPDHFSSLISRIAPASEPRRIRHTSRASPANGEGSNPQGAEHRMRSFLSGAAPSARKVRVACVAVGGLGTSRIAALGAPSCMVRIACSKLAPSIVMSTPRGDK